MRRGRRRYSSWVRVAREVVVWGVRPVEVKEAAVRPVVFCVVCVVVVEGVVVLGLVRAVEDEVCDFAAWFEWRYLPTFDAGGEWGVSADLRSEAPFPRADLLTLALPAAFCCSVRVLMPSWRYLNELRFRDWMFCGSCNVMMSFRPNSSSLTRSRHIFAFTLSRSTVS